MKVTLVTMPMVYNCGASLQAYALQTYLTQLGCNVEILNYQPDYLRHYRLWKISAKYNKPGIRLIYYTVKLPNRIRKLFSKRKRVFDDFTKNHLKLSKKKYHNLNKLIRANLSSDMWIVGSDMVWNPELQNGKDSVFFLNFVQNGVKASYAASIATQCFKNELFLQNIRLLKNFAFISVREKSNVKDLALQGIESVCVCDPVFLLDKTYWMSFAKNYQVKNQIFLYDFEHSLQIQSLADNLNYSVVNYFDSAEYCGPIGFLRGILESKIIISNSYHATLFSIIFQKDFWVLRRKEHDINLRFTDLLDMLDLKERLIENVDLIYLNEKNNSINWSKVEPKLNDFIRFSKNMISIILKKG